MNINLQNCNLEDGFWNVNHPYIVYRCRVTTHVDVNGKECTQEECKRAIQKHLYNVYKLLLRHVRFTHDYKYRYPREEHIPVPFEVYGKELGGETTFTHHHPLFRTITHANGEEEVVEGEEITLEVSVKVEETAEANGKVNLYLSTFFYIRGCAFTARDVDGGFIVSANAYSLPTYGVHPWDELFMTPEQELDVMADAFEDGSCFINIEAGLVQNKTITPLMGFTINSTKSPMEIVIYTTYTPEYLIEKGYIVGDAEEVEE